MIDKIRGCLLGLACGDAVGTTVEFQDRGEFKPLTTMVGGGPFRLKVGQWTDDTSMALCLGHSLLTKKTFDPIDQMNRYCNWFNYGYMSSTGVCFDIGMTTVTALNRYMQTKDPYAGSTSNHTAGNGSIMRLAPIPIFYSNSLTDTIKFAELSSKTTHGAPEAVECTKILSNFLHLCFLGKDKTEMLSVFNDSNTITRFKDTLFLTKTIDRINGSGYSVDCLEAALWCFYNTTTLRDAILEAANLGDDADTTAAVCGQIAGAFYGETGIPDEWKQKLFEYEDIGKLAESLYEVGNARESIIS